MTRIVGLLMAGLLLSAPAADAAQPSVETFTGTRIPGSQLGERIALRCESPLVGLKRRFRRELFADVVKYRQRRRLSIPIDDADRREYPQRLSLGSPDVQPHVVGPAVAPDAFDERLTLRRIHVIPGDRLADRVRWRHTNEACCAGIDCEHAMVVETADDRREGTQLEELRIGMVRQDGEL